MTCTEKEAQEKWCPKVQVFPDGGDHAYVATNRGERAYPGEIDTGCIGSRCMVWEWVESDPWRFYCENRDASTEAEAGERPGDMVASGRDFSFVPDGERDFAHWIETEESADKNRMGHCGLAKF